MLDQYAIERLVARLSDFDSPRVVATISVRSVESENEKTPEEQGTAISAINNKIQERLPLAIVYRTLWRQVVLVSPDNPDLDDPLDAICREATIPSVSLNKTAPR